MSTISTWELNRLTVNNALNVQTQLAQSEVQQSSGLVAQDFGTMGGVNSSQTLSLESEISQAQTWSANATTVGSTTQGVYTAIGTMSTIMSDLQSKISTAVSSATPQDLVPQANTLLTTLVGEMNTQIAGQYVFSGSNSGVPAVNMSNYPSYYQGDDNPASVRVSQQQTIQYGVLGNNTAFQQALAAMTQAINAFQVGTVSGSSVTGTTTEPSATTPLGIAGSFSLNGSGTINILSTDSLTDIANKITNAPDSTVSATVSGNQLQLTSTATPAASNLVFTGLSGNVLSSLGITPTMSTATSAQSTSVLNNALDLANEAVTSLANLQQTVATSSSQLQAISQQQSTFVTYLQNNLSDVKDVNTGQVAAQVSQYQTQLQASYLALADVTKVDLVQYL